MATFMRGAKPTPRHKLLAAMPHRVVKAPPPEFAVVPKKLSYWLNNITGICVTTDEAYAKAVWSIMCGLPELFIPDEEVGRWAQMYGFYDGADLGSVMDRMAVDGFTVNGVNYKDGPKHGVDYSDEVVLQSAISTGPVKIGIDANALPSGAGNHSGWYSISTGHFGNEDHCTGLSGYGTAGYLFQKLFEAGLITSPSVPTELVGLSGYLLFTWDTIGFVTHGWLMGTCAEAWVRTPTTPGQGPTPTPGPTPGPDPTPPPAPPLTLTVSIDLPSLPVAVSGSLGRVFHGSTSPTTVTGTGTLNEVQGLSAEARAGLRTFLQLLVKYGLPIAVALLPLVLSKGFAVLANPAVIAWVLAAVAAEKAGQPIPPLPVI